MLHLLRLTDRQCIGSPQMLGLDGIYIDRASAPSISLDDAPPSWIVE